MFNPLIFLVLIPVLLATFIVFDKLVLLEYFEYKSNWERDGKPHGFFWVPPECRVAGGLLVRFGSSAALQRKSFAWLFSTPEWMRRDKRALTLVRWFRVLVFSWNVGLSGAVVIHLFFKSA